MPVAILPVLPIILIFYIFNAIMYPNKDGNNTEIDGLMLRNNKFEIKYYVYYGRITWIMIGKM